MTTVHPILALTLALLCGLLSTPPKGAKRFVAPNLWSLVAYAVLLIAANYLAIRFGQIDDRRAIVASTVAGGMVAILATVFGELSFGVGSALAVAGACIPHLVRADAFPQVGLSYAFSVAVAVLFFSPKPPLLAASVVGVLIPMADYLGKAQYAGIQRATVGFVLGLALCVATVVVLGVRKAVPKLLGRLESCFSTLLAAGAGYVTAKWFVSGGDLWIVLGITAIAGLAVHWLVPPDETPAPFQIGIATVIWLSIGTIGFSLLKGFGMAASMVEAVFLLALLGNGRAILTVGPTLGLLVFRVLREASPDSSKALDIGQHYGITAVIIGAMLPVLYSDWHDQLKPEKAPLDALSSILWGFVLISLPVLTIVVLGAKGSSGVVVGLGLSGFILISRGSKTVMALAAALAAGIANALAVDWIGESMSLSRGEKLHAFGWWTAAVAIAAVAIVALSYRKKTEAVR